MAKEQGQPKVSAIPLNVNTFTKPRNLEFIEKHGAEAFLVVLQTWLAIAQEKELKIQAARIKYIPFSFRADEKLSLRTSEEVIRAALDFGLLEFRAGYYFNSQITKYVESLGTWDLSPMNSRRSAQNAARNKNSVGANAKSNSRRNLITSLNSDPSLLKSNLKQIDVTSRNKKKSYLKQEEDPSTKGAARNAGANAESDGAKSKGRPARMLPELPRELEHAQKDWEDFVLYRRREKKKPVTPSNAEGIYKKYALAPGDFTHDIRESMERGWVGLRRQFADQNEFAPTGAKYGANANNGAARNQKTNVDRNLELLALRLKDEQV